MQSRTVLTQIEITEGRAVIAHFLQIISDAGGVEVARSNPHTVCFMPDADHAKMLTAINQDITTRDGMLWQPIPQAEWDRAVAHCAVEHTPEVKAAYEAWKLALSAK